MPVSKEAALAEAAEYDMSPAETAAYVRRRTGEAAPAAPSAPAPAAPKAAPSPAAKPAPRSTLLVTPPAAKPAVAAPPKPIARPAYQMEEQVVVGSQPASIPLTASKAPSGTLTAGDDRLFHPLQPKQTDAERIRAEQKAKGVTGSFSPSQSPIARLAADTMVGARAAVNEMKRPEQTMPSVRPVLTPAAEMLRRQQGITENPVLYKAPPEALSPYMDQRREQVREALGMPGDNGSAPPAVVGATTMPDLDPKSKAAVSILLTRPGATNETVYSEYLAPGAKGLVALQHDALMRARGQTR